MPWRKRSSSRQCHLQGRGRQGASHGGAIYRGRSLADAMEAGMLEGQSTNALRQIMVGCMAQRGYAMTVVTVPQ